MQTFKLTTFRQSRVLLGLLLLPFAFIGLLLLGLELGSPFYSLLLLGCYIFLWYYFSVGQLIVTLDNDHLLFSWTKKLLFNYRHIDAVDIAAIKTIVIDNGRFLRKLITDERTVFINTTKIKPYDNFKLIYFLQKAARKNNITVINSWQEWADKGYLKVAYRINLAIIVFAFIAVSISIVFGGFSNAKLLIFLLFIPQYILHGQLMKMEMRKGSK